MSTPGRSPASVSVQRGQRRREIERTGDTHTLPPHQLIVLDCPAPLALMPAARRLQRLLKDTFGLDWEIVAGTAVPV